MSSRVQRANAIRALAMDAVQKAASGHPGAPMGLADVAEVLWRDVLRYNPTNPDWWNRDRFVLSNGHGSMLLYAVLHLTGYDVAIEDIQNFRQLESKTPGHPEFGECPGIETTTGPLGQGFANAVGMALAERLLSQEFNQPDFAIVDHHTWVCVGDGCLMEGISHEAASLAGTLKLGKLIAIYDDNGISIDGAVDKWYTEDVVGRFAAYGWHVIANVDGHNADDVLTALHAGQEERDRPTLICCQTTIGFGAPTKAGTADAHGSPLGEDEITATRERLNWTSSPFQVPDAVRTDWDMRERGKALETQWNQCFGAYADAHPELAAEFKRRMHGDLPDDWERLLDAHIAQLQSEPTSLETRKASGACLDILAPKIPELLGGSADLTGSNNTQWKGSESVLDGGRYLNYGVREFGMTAIANGLALHGGFIPYTGTFLVFMDYARNAVRLASLMGIRNIFVYTHDSVGLGEDGPTHQPVEHLTNIRTTPNMSVWRPCDSVETAVAWKAALTRLDGPTAIVLTRQKTVPQRRDDVTVEAIELGGYVLRTERGDLDLMILATGSEVELAQAAASQLEGDGFGTRVVALPSIDRFLAQPKEYQEAVIPSSCRSRVAVEASHPDYWRRFVGLDGAVVGIDRFGVSAPGAQAMEHLGMTAEAVVAAAKSIVAK